MPSSKRARGKQRLDRRDTLRPNAEGQPGPEANPGTHKLLAGAEQFSAAGLRYPPEAAIHNELYAIKFISEINQ
jgi:hypothetical protein